MIAEEAAPKQTTNGDRLTNAQALEQLFNTLEVAPSVAQIAAGRKLATIVDGEPNAAMMSVWLDWLATIESAMPEEPDALDAAQ